MALTKITTSVVAVNSLTVANIADNAIDATKIASNSILTRHIDDAQITTDQILDGTIATADIADDAVTEDKLANAINTSIAAKLPLAGGTLTGALTTNGVVNTGTSHNFALNTPNSLRINIDSNNSATDQIFVIGHNQTSVDNNNALMTILESGNVGIGVSSPSQALEVTGITLSDGYRTAVDNTNYNLLTRNSSNTAVYIQQAGSGNILDVQSGSAGAGQGTSRLLVNSSGNVGIGTTSPSTGLHVVTAGGTTPFRVQGGANSGVNIMEVGYAGGSAGANFIVDDNGDVLIGQTSQTGYGFAQKLVVGDGNDNDGITIQSGSTHQGNLAFNHSDGTTAHGRISYQHQSNYMQFFTNNTERMRINHQGNISFGAQKQDPSISQFFNGITGNYGSGLSMQSNGYAVLGLGNNFFINSSTQNQRVLAQPTQQLQLDHLGNFLFQNAASGTAGATFNFSEKMRLDLSGSLFIGTQSEATGSTGGVTFSADSNDRRNLICATTATGNLELIEFRNPNGTVGDIKTNGSGTSYNTSSDYRLKENVDYTWDATTRLKQLKPARFNFKVDADTTIDGFLAHEVSSIVPIAVSGEKDGEKMQSIDHSKLVPLLVKTIQELEARIATLES